MTTEPNRPRPLIDPVAAQRAARQVSQAGSPWLHEEVGRRMQERLQWITLQPRCWLHWAPLRAGLHTHARIVQRYPQAQAYIVEPEVALRPATAQALGSPWWQIMRGRSRRTQMLAAPPDEGVDLLWANMSLHATAQPQALIAQWQRSVAAGGFLMFSCLGPDTLIELRMLYERMGWPPPAQPFTDMHDWGDMLVQAGFADPVMDMERIVLTWSTPQAALAELRTLGRNLHPARFAALRGRRWMATLEQALAGLGGAADDGRIALSFEVIYGHAFRLAPRVAVTGESAVSLRDMRALLRRGR